MTAARASQMSPRVKMEPGRKGSSPELVNAISRPMTVSERAKMANCRSKPYQRPSPSRAVRVPTRVGSRRSVLISY